MDARIRESLDDLRRNHRTRLKRTVHRLRTTIFPSRRVVESKDRAQDGDRTADLDEMAEKASAEGLGSDFFMSVDDPNRCTAVERIFSGFLASLLSLMTEERLAGFETVPSFSATTTRMKKAGAVEDSGGEENSVPSMVDDEEGNPSEERDAETEITAAVSRTGLANASVGRMQTNRVLLSDFGLRDRTSAGRRFLASLGERRLIRQF